MYNKIFKKSYITQGTMDEFIKEIDKIEDCVWVKNKEGFYLNVNESLCKLLGEKKENLLKINNRDIFLEDSFNLIVENDVRVINTKKKSVMNEYLYIKGKEVLLHTNKIPIIGNDGNCNSFLAIGSIISDYGDYGSLNDSEEENLKVNLIMENDKSDEETLYSSIYDYLKDLYIQLKVDGISIWSYNEKNKTIIKKISVGIAGNMLDETSMSISDEYISRIMNYKSNILNPFQIQKLNEMYNEPMYYDRFKDIFNSAYINIIPITYKDNFLGILNLYYSNENDVYSENIKYVNHICDRIALSLKNIFLCNELKDQLSQKIHLENQMRRFLSIASDLSFIVDEEGYIRKMSSNASKVLGWSNKELRAIPIQCLIKVTSSSVNYQEVLTTYDKKCDGGVCKVKCKDGAYKLLEWYYYHDSYEKEIYIVGKDVTKFAMLEQKVTDLELKSEKEMFKTEFLANVSHEFKTPLNIILSGIKLELLNSDDSKKINRLNMIKNNSYRLLRLINNLIDINEVDMNYSRLNKKNIDFIEFLENRVDLLVKKGAELDRSIIFDTTVEELFLGCDVIKIEKVLFNLVSNAMKYSCKNGEIFISVYRDDEKVYVSIKDDGIGIPEENYENIFERFKQVDNVFIRRAEGSGIGLPLSKSFVELHDGEIFFNREIEEGTEVIFSLPIILSEENNLDYIYNDSDDFIRERMDIEFSDIYF